MALLKKTESLEGLMEALRKAQANRKYVKIAKLYYRIGEYYQQEGNIEKLWLYIHRFDNLSSSQDEIYNKISDKMIDSASCLIGELEKKEDFLPNELIRWAEKEAKSLDIIQKVKWNLLTVARFEKLFMELSRFKDFAFLSRFGVAVDAMVQLVYFPNGEAYGRLLDFAKKFYPFIDSMALADVSNCIPIAGGADFEAYDLQNEDTLLNMYILMDDILQYAEQKRKMGDISMNLVTNVLQADYYIRTHDEPLREIPAVQAEVERIREDLEFVKGYPDKPEFVERVEQHRELMIPVNEEV